MAEYNEEQVQSALHAAVQEYGGDYVYEREYAIFDAKTGEPLAEQAACFYSTNPDKGDVKPGCIVGQVIARLNPEGFKSLIAAEGFREGATVDRRLRSSAGNSNMALSTADTEVSREADAALRAAQITQDNGQSWGIVQRVFDESLVALHNTPLPEYVKVNPRLNYTAWAHDITSAIRRQHSVTVDTEDESE